MEEAHGWALKPGAVMVIPQPDNILHVWWGSSSSWFPYYSSLGSQGCRLVRNHFGSRVDQMDLGREVGYFTAPTSDRGQAKSLRLQVNNFWALAGSVLQFVPTDPSNPGPFHALGKIQLADEQRVFWCIWSQERAAGMGHELVPAHLFIKIVFFEHAHCCKYWEEGKASHGPACVLPISLHCA